MTFFNTFQLTKVVYLHFGEKYLKLFFVQCILMDLFYIIVLENKLDQFFYNK